MLFNVSKKFSPANLVFAVYFQDGVDHKKVQQDINTYLSAYSMFALTGIRELDEDSGALGWNMIGLGMDQDFDAMSFLVTLSEHFPGISAVTGVIMTDNGPRHYTTEGLSTLRRAALNLKCHALLNKGINPNHSLSIN